MESSGNNFLDQLNDHYARNFPRRKQGYRYDNDLKLYSAYIRMVSGKSLYLTLKANARFSMPSETSVCRYISKVKFSACEGELRTLELVKYLEEQNLPMFVHLSEDATKITGRIQYDLSTNKIIGFVLPINKQNGMPITSGFEARNIKAIESCFFDLNTKKQKKEATYVNVIMAQPLPHSSPPFCLMIFSSDGSFPKEDVHMRWAYITEDLKKHGIGVCTISSDSDPRYNSVMRNGLNLGIVNKDFPVWFNAKLELNYIPIQDTVHIGTKLRNRLLNNKLKFGKYDISVEHLMSLVKSIPKTEHRLTENIVKTRDRQNFDSVLRICDEKVISLLTLNVKNCEGTVLYLRILSNTLKSFLDPRLSPLERLRHIWFSVFLLRIWRQAILKNKKLTLKDNFVSLPCYVCIEINAHALVYFTMYMRDRNMDDIYSTLKVGSQPCETTFRQVRSFTSTNSTVVNCSLLEIIQRLSKIELQNNIKHIHLNHFTFPGIDNPSSTYFPSADRNGKEYVFHNLPDKKEIFHEIELAKVEALEYAETLGVIPEPNDNLSCNINTGKVDVIAMNNGTDDISSSLANVNLTEDENVNVFKLFGDVQFNDYSEKKIDPDTINETSLHAKVQTNDGKVFVVNKHTLCWFLSKSTEKQSSDRLRRVMSNRSTNN